MAMLRRASASVLSLAIRAVGAPRTFHGVISGAVNPKKDCFVPDLDRASSLRFSTLAKSSSDQGLAQEPLTVETMPFPEKFPFEFQESENAITLGRKFEDATIELVVDIPPPDDVNMPFIPVYYMTATFSKPNVKTYVETTFAIAPNKLTRKDVWLRHPDERYPNNSEAQDHWWKVYGFINFACHNTNYERELMEYIEDRGITMDLANYLHDYITRIRRRRYVLRGLAGES